MFQTKNILVIFFGAVLIMVFATLPFFQGFMESMELLADKEEELRREDEYIERLKEAEEGLRGYSSKLNMIDKAISNDPAVPSLIKYIEDTTRGYGIFLTNLGSFSTSPSRDNPDLQETKISFSVSGGYNSFKSFLNAMEHSSRLISIESLSITPTIEDEGIRYSFNVTIKTYSH